MKLKSLYPITVKLVKDNDELLPKIFKDANPHKSGAFIGVCLLEGSWLCDSPGDLFSDIKIGEVFSLSQSEKGKGVTPLAVCRSDGTVVGNIPYSDSVLPSVLLSRGINVYCYAEAKEFNGGLPEIAVSIYSDKY